MTEQNNSNNRGYLTFIIKFLSSALFISFLQMFKKEIRCFLKLENDCNLANKFGFKINKVLGIIIDLLSIIFLFSFKAIAYFGILGLFVFFITYVYEVLNYFLHFNSDEIDINREIINVINGYLCSIVLILSLVFAFIPIYNRFHLFILSTFFYTTLFTIFFINNYADNFIKKLILTLLISALTAYFIFPKL